MAANDNPQDGPLSAYLKEIELYERDSRNWLDRGKRIRSRYRDERRRDGVDDGRDNGSSRYNVLWSNTQTMLPALYGRNPKPDIMRRRKTADPVGRVAGTVLERCVGYFTDSDCFELPQRQATLDYTLLGRATVWIRYQPTIIKETLQVDDDADDGNADGDAEKPATERLAYEDVDFDYVNAEDFGHNICRTWQEVWCGWRIVYLTRAELIERFKEKGKLPPLDHKEKNDKGQSVDDGIGKSCIYELWDKAKKKAVWLHKTIREPLDEKPDPLRLKDFFPFPRPMLANVANDSLIPVPDYIEYQDQAIELDNLTARIAALTRAVKVAGVYDASAQGIGRLLSEGIENQLIPVEQWALFAEKGGINGAVAFMPLADIVAALQAMYEARERVKQDLWEITGLSDIMRGASDPDETATAQNIKSSYGSMRLTDRQKEVQRFVRDEIRIAVDIICNHFTDDTIKTISGVQLFTKQEKQMMQHQMAAAQQQGAQPPLPPNMTADELQTMMTEPTWEDVFALIRDNPLRCFRIDIETDSTVKIDEQQDKASRVEFIQAIGKYIGEALPAAEQTPQLLPLLVQGLMFLARGFPVGKEFEGVLQTAIQQLEKAAANPQQKPDPAMAKVQADAQLAQQKAQFDQQAAQQKLQTDAQMEQVKLIANERVEAAKAQSNIATEQAKAEAQARVQQHLNQLEAEREQLKAHYEFQLGQYKAQLEGNIELQKAHIQAAASIEVARISAKASDGAEAEAREASGEAA